MYRPDKLSPQSPSTTDEGDDPYTLESMARWLEKQPAKGKYNYYNCQGACLIDLFIVATAEPETFSPKLHSYHDFLGQERAALFQDVVARPWPWTFGAALQRSRAALKGEG